MTVRWWPACSAIASSTLVTFLWVVSKRRPAHREAFIHLGYSDQIEPARSQLITQSLLDWSQEHNVQPSDLGARMTYLADATVPERETRGPDCDFALPML